MILVGSGVVGFVVHRTEHSNAGMAPFGVVPALYPLEYCVRKFGAGLPAPRVEQFELHRHPERLHHRVVVAIWLFVMKRGGGLAASWWRERPTRFRSAGAVAAGSW